MQFCFLSASSLPAANLHKFFQTDNCFCLSLRFCFLEFLSLYDNKKNTLNLHIKANSFAFIKRTDGLLQRRVFDFAYLHSQKPLQNTSANAFVLHNAPEHKIIRRTFFYSFFNIEFFLSPPQESAKCEANSKNWSYRFK